MEEVHRLAQQHPAKGAVAAIEVWAPVAPHQPHAKVYQEVLDQPMHASLRPLGNSHGALRAYLLSRGMASSSPRAPIAAGPLGLSIPPPLRPQLQDRRVDSSLSLADLVAEGLRAAGFETRALQSSSGSYDFEASTDHATVFIRCYHCEKLVPTGAVDRFGYDFLRSHYDEGLFVSDGSIPYDVRHWERNRRIHLVSRSGLQQLVNAIAARLLRTKAEQRAG
jgi:hypothetical protein